MGAIAKPSEWLSGVFRACVIESLCYSNLFDVIARFSKQFPRVRLEFYTDSATQLHKLLTENQVDVIASLARPLDYAYMDIVARCSVRALFATTPANELANKHGVTVEDIATQQLFLTEEESVYRQTLEEHFEVAQSDASAYRVESSHATKELVLRTGGVCYLPEYALSQELRAGTLSALDTAFKTPSVEVIVAQRKEKWHSPQLHALVGLLENMAWI